MAQAKFINGQPASVTQLQNAWNAWARAKGKSYRVNSKQYFSTVSLEGSIATVNAATGKYAVFFDKQVTDCFNYSINSQINLAGVQRPASYADTNMSKAMSCDGSNEMAVTWLGVSCRAITPVFAADQVVGYSALEANHKLCLTGQGHIFDPYGVIAAPICHDPGLLENALMGALSPLTSFELEIDHGSQLSNKLGVLANIPEAGANSYLRSHGEPTAGNRYSLGAGYYWKREGSSAGGTEIKGSVKLEDTLLVPFTAPSYVGPTPGAITFAIPSKVYVELVVTLGGVECSPVGGG